mgnify:CR=1 FL=1
MGVIGLARGEESLERVVAGDDETGKVDEELAGNVEEDKEEVQGGKTEDNVDLGDRALSLKVVECRVLGELYRRAGQHHGRWRIVRKHGASTWALGL